MGNTQKKYFLVYFPKKYLSTTALVLELLQYSLVEAVLELLLAL
jgi:hypothetical protein